MNYTTASKLVKELVDNHSFSDGHSMPSHTAAESAIFNAGLGVVYFPYSFSKKITEKTKWHMMMGIVDGASEVSGGSECEAAEKHIFHNLSESPIYCMVECVPMTEYVGTLVTCNLGQLWWAVPSFFSTISQLLQCDLAEYRKTNLGRSHWGQIKRKDIQNSFASTWNEETTIEPSEFKDPAKLRFFTVPVLTRAKNEATA